MLPSVNTKTSALRSIHCFHSSITRPTYAPFYASRSASRLPVQDTGSGWIRASFPVGLFHSLLHAGLARRTVFAVSKLQRAPSKHRTHQNSRKCSIFVRWRRPPISSSNGIQAVKCSRPFEEARACTSLSECSPYRVIVAGWRPGKRI